jgi:PHS family inorganic phosphate transporter-like MFS transporter
MYLPSTTEELESPLLSPAETAMSDNINDEEGETAMNDNINDEEGEVIMLPPPTPTTEVISSSFQEPWYRNRHQMTAMLSNFSTSYNVVNISLVLPILESLHEASEEALSACASSLLAGMMVGQIVGGALGDSFLGRLGALRLVMAIQIIASLGSSCLNTNKEDFYESLAIWRFFLGIGAGGVYPLAAVLSAEQGKDQRSNNGETDDGNQTHRVVLTFSTQGLGFIAVPIVAVVLFQATENLNLIWRLLLGFGCVPGLILMLIQWRMYAIEHSHGQPVPLEEGHAGDDEEIPNAEDEIGPESEELLDEPTTEVIDHDNVGWWKSLLDEPGLGRKVVGTAGTWCLFDIIFYGNTIFQPIVVEAAFGASEAETPFQELSSTARKSLILASIALPGYFVAALLMGKQTLCITQTPRYVMMQGFAAMGILYLVIGINWSYLRHYPAVLIFLYGMTFFFANYGPNTTTFILPSLLYSPEHRTTWNGISAACGKLGALVGASLFAPAADDLGDNAVMLICAGLSIVALFLTCIFVPKLQHPHQS